METHRLKTVQPYFEQCWRGKKNFEIRENDRGFQVGDEVFLMEYDEQKDELVGRELRGEITYVLEDYPAVKKGHVVFAYRGLQKITHDHYHDRKKGK